MVKIRDLASLPDEIQPRSLLSMQVDLRLNESGDNLDRDPEIPLDIRATTVELCLEDSVNPFEAPKHRVLFGTYFKQLTKLRHLGISSKNQKHGYLFTNEYKEDFRGLAMEVKLKGNGRQLKLFTDRALDVEWNRARGGWVPVTESSCIEIRSESVGTV